MSDNLVEGNVAGHPETAAYLVVRNDSGEFVMVQGVTDGDYAALKVTTAAGLGDSRKITAKTNIAVTNGATVNFVLDVDGDGAVLPSDMEIQAIIIQPHDGATPPVAVENRWIFKMYTHSNRYVDDLFFSTDRVSDGRPASSDAFILHSKLGYINEEAGTSIPCSLYIEMGDTDATFTVKVIFA